VSFVHALCNGKIRSYHPHVEVLAVELREFLHSVTSIPATCISKACDLNIRRGLKCVAGKQYFPPWEKGEKKVKVN